MIEQIMEHLRSIMQIANANEIQETIKEFTAWTKDNPVVGGVVGVWFLGVMSYWLADKVVHMLSGDLDSIIMDLQEIDN